MAQNGSPAGDVPSTEHLRRPVLAKGAAWQMPVIAIGAAAPESASRSGYLTFTFHAIHSNEGVIETFDLRDVCPDASTVTFTVVGGQGASTDAEGGLGAAISGTVSITDSLVFTLIVGAGGADNGGWGFGKGGDGATVGTPGGPGGGGGGGGSALALGDRLVAVAAGGGGSPLALYDDTPSPSADTAAPLSTRLWTTQFSRARTHVKWGDGNAGDSSAIVNGYAAYGPDGAGCAGLTPRATGSPTVFLAAPGGASAIDGEPGASDSGVVLLDDRYSSTWINGNPGDAGNGPHLNAEGTSYRGGNGGHAVRAPGPFGAISSGGGGGGYAGGASGGAGVVTRSISVLHGQRRLQYATQGGAGSNYVSPDVVDPTIGNGTYGSRSTNAGGNGWITLRWH